MSAETADTSAERSALSDSDAKIIAAVFDGVRARLASRRLFAATYRLQLTDAQFRFDDAVKIAGYLADLGISHVYASPCTTAFPGSTHGYDVIDHTRINPELGGQ